MVEPRLQGVSLCFVDDAGQPSLASCGGELILKMIIMLFANLICSRNSQ